MNDQGFGGVGFRLGGSLGGERWEGARKRAELRLRARLYFLIWVSTDLGPLGVK